MEATGASPQGEVSVEERAASYEPWGYANATLALCCTVPLTAIAAFASDRVGASAPPR